MANREIIDEWADQVNMNGVESDTLNAFFGALRDAVNDAGVPDNLKSAVEDELNSRCSLRFN